MMGAYKDFLEKRQTLIMVYHDVAKKFKDLNVQDVTIKYAPDMDDYAVLSPYGEDEKRKKPTLFVGHLMFNLDKEEIEAVIAHELGHYVRIKNYSWEKFKKQSDWSQEIGDYTSHMLKDEAVKHRVKRLQNWYFLIESYADKQAADKGYAKHIVSSIKKINRWHEKEMPLLAKRNDAKRIKSLEKILKEKR
ncbi:hypothetical protein FJZ53_01400 [Candidatus Woesearchaeota archaeon]|nr:hypothetical protein [Candidatus Woesearchaeota archaeon]